MRGLDVSYGDVQVLFDVDFEVDEGEIIALLGTNGAGKSTLLKAICGVVEADKGAVIFDGRDITHAPPDEIAAFGIAQVPGGQGVFPALTVAENLRVAGWLDRHRRQQNAAAGRPRCSTCSRCCASRLDEPAANLSGGQQQMLALGMAFLARPRLLLIDELSLGLAPVVVEQLLPIVEAIRAQGTTIILVEQSVNVALTVAETAYFMEKGEIRFHGPTAELLERPDVLAVGVPRGRRRPNAMPPGGPLVPGHASAGTAAVGGTSDGGPTVPASPGHGGRPSRRCRPWRRRGLSVRFGGIRAVDDVSLVVAPGEIVGIIGPNGAGKTTLFDLISGFTRADSGPGACSAGIDVTRLGPDRRARLGLGRSFQDARLFPALTVEETIAVALERWVDVDGPAQRRRCTCRPSFDSERRLRATGSTS